MKTSAKSTIYTIGHSTHSLEDFIKMLQSFGIKTLADIRRFPGSRKYPHFNKENLEAELRKNKINYTHLENLGGRRKVRTDSKNTLWRNESFRGYADYMETEDFEKAIVNLETIASEQLTAFMCSEAVWWRCHRSMVSDYLKAKNWAVMHIMGVDKTEEHPYTSPAHVMNNRVFYTEINLFNQ